MNEEMEREIERRVQAYKLRQLSSDEGIKKLSNALHNTIGREAVNRHLGDLDEIFIFSHYETVRKEAAETLGKIGSAAAIEVLVNALNDKNSSVRSSAARGLGYVNSEAAIKVLVNALNDENSSVRSSAAKALEKIENRRKL